MTTTKDTVTIAIYGATGVTGGHLLTELNRRGITPILVGRNADRLHTAAAAAGIPDAEIRLADLDDHQALVAAFTGADAVISSLPAYVSFGEAVVAAAIDAGAHYTDMSGEQLFIKRVFDEYAARAEAAGVTAVPGITNSNIPGDLLGHLTAQRLTGPVEISISLHGTSEGHGSKGSARTVLASLDWFRSGGWHYQEGELRTGTTTRHAEMTFPGDTEPTAVSKFPQPPVLTLPRHTNVSYVEGVLETAFHSQLSSFTAEIVESLPEEPTPGLTYDLVVDSYAADGNTVRGVVSGRDAYVDSALMAVEVAARLTNGSAAPGVLAPAEAFDPTDFLNSLSQFGITWRITR
ncbi:saccharopine dehydrogenase NADP-binding domain-containing protein [Nocardia sp. NBC_00565]|uniref:saccharopine dehydrogenase NADP-binding domain-containing protein n=1 Tax=Nocardia sp. NBC_00565 TaxID=2975993 RepID=UPI002E8189EC|nr:saccharopine dehydrogenase NADP-binding domain-containing protein [Nocardia sp. NBC_00565]WUC02458.1 saccharopine dehydrogenase NADP-binding domain-containing protein [Nocardia sp. NBC_00565]